MARIDADRETIGMLRDRLGITTAELVKRVGVKDVGSLSRVTPRAWYAKLGIAEPGTLDDELDKILGREQERPPQAPPGATRVKEPPPAPTDLGLGGELGSLDYSEIEGLIATVYKGAAGIVENTDPPLAMMIASHADEAAQAWAEWIRSNPKAAAFLQRMMVGTPMGKVISVHLGIGVGYYFARREYIAAIEQQAADAEAAGADLP